MDIEEIHREIVNRLTEQNYNVGPAEKMEGFKKPSFFVELDYGVITEVNPFFDDVELEGSVQYIPKVETKYELLKCQKLLRNILLRNPIKTSEGSVCIHELIFDTSLFPSLVATFKIAFTEQVITDDETEEMKDLEIGGI